MDRAKRFYETVLETKLSKLENPGPPSDMQMWAFPMDEKERGAAGTLVKMQGVPSGGGGTLVYFMCADCAVEEARVAQAGGQVDRSKFSIGPYGFIALAVDTEGNMFGLHSMQ
jgi:uncharacterized protein